MFKRGAACLAVGISVEVRYQRYADNAVALPPAVGYQSEIGEDNGVSPPGIVAINLRIHVLDVNDKCVYHREQGRDIVCRNI